MTSPTLSAPPPNTATSAPQRRERLSPRTAPRDPSAGQTMSTPLDRSSIVIYCVVCIKGGRATEATYQTRDTLLCGCDQHIQQLEQHGFAALYR
jgi:hypothetical protein